MRPACGAWRKNTQSPSSPGERVHTGRVRKRWFLWREKTGDPKDSPSLVFSPLDSQKDLLLSRTSSKKQALEPIRLFAEDKV